MISAGSGCCIKCFRYKHACFAFSQLNSFEEPFVFRFKIRSLVFVPCMPQKLEFLLHREE